MTETTVAIRKATRDRLASTKYDLGCDSYDAAINHLLESHDSEGDR